MHTAMQKQLMGNGISTPPTNRQLYVVDLQHALFTKSVMKAMYRDNLEVMLGLNKHRGRAFREAESLLVATDMN